ncbi:MAG: DUF1186 domain-containing protein [Pirellulales bacterium]
MTDREASLLERLSEAESPRHLTDWERRDGYYVATCRATAEDIPSLINLVREWSDIGWPGDADLPQIDDAELLPITAWRTLADLKATAAVKPLVDMLCALDDEFSDDEFGDWECEELPHVFGKIGESAIEPLTQLAKNDDKSDFIRSIAVCGLRYVAQYHPETRGRTVACLTEMMANACDGHFVFKSTLLMGLVELRAVEAAQPIERAFADNLLDVGMMGDWEDVRRELGVESLGLKMPVNPHSSISGLRTELGVGIFSDQPIFPAGEIDHDAEQAYYERAHDTFSKSNEAQQVVERHGDLGWFHMLLEFGINYLGEIVDEMSPGSVSEFVLDYVPRKVSTDAESAASIIDELNWLWEFLDRVYGLPSARQIVEWLETEGLVARLEAKLSDPSNFGMAKSFVMLGKQSGYDMTSEAELAQFAAEYNRSHPSTQPAAPITREQRVGRNAPCPCGSGKKFKKCCGR